MTRSILFLCISLTFSNVLFGQLGKNVDLVGHLSYSTNICNDIWGYVDSTGNEYALLGTIAGESIVDLSDPTNPTQLFFTPGPYSLWRDWKTFGDYAYVSNESANGIRIFDLSGLPDSINYKDTIIMGVSTIHNLWIDDSGYLYAVGCNEFNGGMMIMDLNADPWNPNFAGAYDETYVHDVYVRGNMAYSAEIYDGELTIIDVADKTQPQILGGTSYLNSFTHNTWLNDAGTVCFTTDELDNAYIYSWDISDPTNITQLDGIRSSGSNGTATPHNAHVLNDFLVVSYYKDGIVIIDARRPESMVEVASYDTNPDSGGGIDGSWGAYPFLPSGLILASDMSQGLFVLQTDYPGASFIEGVVTDATTSAAISDVDVSIGPSTEELTTSMAGSYSWGTADTGQYQLTFAKYGYESQGVTINLGVDTIINQSIQLVSTPRTDLNILVREAGSLMPIEDALIRAVPDSGEVAFEWTTDAAGMQAAPQFVDNTYHIYVGKWGYQAKEIIQDVVGGTQTLIIDLEVGYMDNFVLDFGWEVTGEVVANDWERAIPIGTSDSQQQIAPDADILDDFGDFAYVTGNIAADAESGDIDNFETILTSPLINTSEYGEAMLRFHYWLVNWHPQSGATGNGSLKVKIVSSVVSVDVASYNTALGNSWTLADSIRIKDFFPIPFDFQVQFIATGGFAADLVEAGIDGFEIFDAKPTTAIENPLNENQFAVYPNPIQESLSWKLDLTDLSHEDYTLEIKTVQGQVLRDVSLSSDMLEHTMDFPYAAGIYFVSLKQEGQVRAVRKVVRTQ